VLASVAASELMTHFGTHNRDAAIAGEPYARSSDSLVRHVRWGARVRRREFIGLLGSATAWPLAARAQQPTVPVIGYLDTASVSTTAHFIAEFRRGLKDAGYVEGQNVAVEYRLAEGDYGRLPVLADELVRRQVAVIATINTPTILAAKAATQTIPIVFAVGVDPVKFGLVASLNRPGGNLTGLTQLNIEMEAKRVQVLHELAPAATSIAMLINPTSPAYSEAATESAQSAARVLGVRLLTLERAPHVASRPLLPRLCKSGRDCSW
jgi:putative tryptophan/tyrosine transport system substrate-binding protein